MFEAQNLLIALLLFFGAILYTSVGHAGSSVYIAIMTFFNLPPVSIKPTALTLNISVSSFASFRYIKNNFFKKKLLLFLVAGSIPAAFIGGHINLSSEIYKPIIGVLLLISGIRFIFQREFTQKVLKEPIYPLAVVIGAAIGLLSGLTGTGGGIFLSPLLLTLGWATIKEISGTASVFILVNSIAGLLGNYKSTSSIPSTLPLFLVAVMLGALIGTKLGISRFSNAGIKRALGFVLLIASAKLIFAA